MKTLACVVLATAIFSANAMAESEETRYFRLQCEQLQEKSPCDLYHLAKEDEKLPDNKRSRLIGLDSPYSILIDQKTGLAGRLDSNKRKYTKEEKKKYANIADKEYKEAVELELSEKGGIYRFDVSGIPKDKNGNVMEALFSNKDYVYLYFRSENTPDKYDKSTTHYTYFVFDRKYKSLIELFYFRGNYPRQGAKPSHPALSKNENNYTFAWSGTLDGDKVKIYYVFSVLPNEHMDCKKSWDEGCEGMAFVPRKQ